MKRVVAIGFVAGLGLLAACEEKKPEATPATGSASAAVTASAAPSAALSASAAPVATAAGETEDDVADEEDFGEEASKAIDDKNFESELDKLEKEIGK